MADNLNENTKVNVRMGAIASVLLLYLAYSHLRVDAIEVLASSPAPGIQDQINAIEVLANAPAPGIQQQLKQIYDRLGRMETHLMGP